MQLTGMLDKKDQSSLWRLSAIQWNPFIHDYMPVSAAKSPSYYKDRKKQAATAVSKPWGVCEKLFNAFQPALRPLRRLTFRQQEGPAASPADSSPAEASHGPVPQSKLPEPVAPPRGKSKLPEVLHNPKPKHQEKPDGRTSEGGGEAARPGATATAAAAAAAASSEGGGAEVKEGDQCEGG